MSATFVDPGLGSKTAKVGTEDWAKRWRLDLQSIVKDARFDVEHVSDMVLLGQKHRVWTMLQRKDGSRFKDWNEFVSHEYPWGLSENPERIRALLEASKGKRATQLETVPEPKTKWDGSASNDLKLNHGTAANLRAINRAPSIVADLYRDGLINQVDAARLGKKDADKSEIAAEIARVVQETAELDPKERRRAINETARAIAGAKRKTPAELAIANFRKCEDRLEPLKAIVSELEPHELVILRDSVNRLVADTNCKGLWLTTGADLAGH